MEIPTQGGWYRESMFRGNRYRDHVREGSSHGQPRNHRRPGQPPLRLATPRPGWVEQSPELWWESTVSVLEQLTIDRNCQVMGVSVSGQMHSLVPLDAQGDVVRPAILWSDQRTVLHGWQRKRSARTRAPGSS